MSLTVGFACTCLLVSFLISEGNVDSFHSKKDRTYELTSNDPFGGTMGQGRISYTSPWVAEYFLKNYPEVENVCQVSNISKAELSINDDLSAVQTIGVDTSFFTLFEFPLIAGSKKDLGAAGLMITESKARQLFGTSNVLGRTVEMRSPDSTKLLTITGIIGESTEKSHLKFDVAVAYSAVEKSLIKNKPGGITYILLRNQANAGDLLGKVNSDTLRPTLLGQGKMEYFLDPIERSYTSPWNVQPFTVNRSATFISVGWIVCGVILFMAAFNFVNLFLLSIQERKKETGIQKTLGISLWQTMRHSATEAGLYIGLSFVLSLALGYALLPVFNSSLNADLQFDYLTRFKVLLIVGGALVVIAAIVILTSTIQQRRTLPVSMMRNVSAKVKYSKLFFTVQFFVSITLCVCTITIVKQMKFLENEPLGFNRNIMQLNTPKKGSERAAGLKNSLSQIAGIENIALSFGNPISGNMIMYLELEDKRQFNPYLFSGDEDLMKTLDLQVVEGKLEFNNKEDMIVNETLVKYLDLKDPIGKEIPTQKGSKIVAVVKDFTCASFKQEIPPVIINYAPEAHNLLIDYGKTDINALLPTIESVWKRSYPDSYFDYKIIQQDLMQKYSEETLFYKVVLSASITSMVISCFGMFALSWAVIRSRAKEMSIRKVLGASVSNILGLLTISFAKRLMLAFVLAAPAGYYLMNLWLSRFVYKAPIDSWVFIITGISLTAIAVITLGIQTLKASLSSPLEEIKE